MLSFKLYPHQKDVLEQTGNQNHVAYYMDMGLGKTFVGSEKANSYPNKILVVCQKSKIQDWIDHFGKYYPLTVFDLTKKKQYQEYFYCIGKCVGVINYDLIFRRKEMAWMTGFTMILDESSMIQNEKAKRSKFILGMYPENVILLSGTPTAGKYENLWSQIRLLGWGISKETYLNQYTEREWIDTGSGFQIQKVTGYKNVDRLKEKLRSHGAIFIKTEEVMELPEQVIVPVRSKTTKEYRKFMKEGVVTVGGRQFVGDTILTKRIYARMLCSYLNQDRIQAFRDLMESTQDRLIVFYNYDAELELLLGEAEMIGRPTSQLNGHVKDLAAYEEESDSITFVQYQAGAMGVNLQKANKVIYFSLTDRSELFEQSKKRVHRIGQNRTCFYYIMTCSRSVEEDIYKTLLMRKDYTDDLFKKYQEKSSR